MPDETMLNAKPRYPRVVVDREKLGENLDYVIEKCGDYGVEVAGVIKGANGIPGIIPLYLTRPCVQIASSRLEQLRRVREMDPGHTKDTLLLRIPMLSEIEEVVELCDVVLVSEEIQLKALDRVAAEQGKTVKVILMADLGDLREGWWDRGEMLKAALLAENELENIRLEGVGTNLGCYGSIVPTKEKLDELVEVAEMIEAEIGRKLRFISGGATSSFMRVLDGDLPVRINHLRIGEVILLARDLELFYGYDLSGMHMDAFTLEAEVIEVKDKPSHPVGELGIDAFGHTQTYVDRGIRKRALIGVGKVDMADPFDLFPRDEGIEVLGASSDHTILDIEGCPDIKVGDILEFDLNYGSLVHLTSAPGVRIVYK